MKIISDCAPSYTHCFWDLSGFEDSVRDAAEGGPDIEGNHECLPITRVGLSWIRPVARHEDE